MTYPVAVDLSLLRSLPLPALPEESDKEARGSVLVVAGGAQVPGAPVLTGLAALRAGAGKLKLAAVELAAVALGVAVPEAAIVGLAPDAAGEIGDAALEALVEAAGLVDAVVVGPGMMGEAGASLAARLAARAPEANLVLDAAALSDLLRHGSELAAAAGRLVLTPHAGEMAGLIGWPKDRIHADPAAAAGEAAHLTGAVVALKGETTWIASPEGELWRHDGGVVGLGTSGSGDVLAGIIGGLLARGATPAAAALRGVFVHGRAGELLTRRIGPLGFLAREIVDVTPEALAASAPNG